VSTKDPGVNTTVAFEFVSYLARSAGVLGQVRVAPSHRRSVRPRQTSWTLCETCASARRRAAARDGWSGVAAVRAL